MPVGLKSWRDMISMARITIGVRTKDALRNVGIMGIGGIILNYQGYQGIEVCFGLSIYPSSIAMQERAWHMAMDGKHRKQSLSPSLYTRF